MDCGDQKPLPDAALKYSGAGDMGGTKQPATSPDGTYSSTINVAEGSALNLKVDKDGYTSKEVPLTPGADQVICLDRQK